MTWTPENLTFSEQQAQGPEPGRSWRGRGAPAGPGWGGVPYPVSSSARTNSYLAPRNHPATPRGVSLPTPGAGDSGRMRSRMLHLQGGRVGTAHAFTSLRLAPPPAPTKVCSAFGSQYSDPVCDPAGWPSPGASPSSVGFGFSYPSVKTVSDCHSVF